MHPAACSYFDHGARFLGCPVAAVRPLMAPLAIGLPSATGDTSLVCSNDCGARLGPVPQTSCCESQICAT
jgi:hypothetical protein